MFDSLQGRLGDIFDKLTKRGALSEADVDLAVVREFVAKAKEQAIGQEVVRSVTPGQMVIKIVNDVLVEMLGSDAVELNLTTVPPAVIMMVGLQGSGKTTSENRQTFSGAGKEEGLDGLPRYPTSSRPGTIAGLGRTDRHSNPADH
jgi:signal recognition particle GTPase